MILRSHIIRGTLVAVLAVPVLAYGWGKVFGWHRPYVNQVPWELAEYLTEHHRPPSDCFDLIWFEIMSPTAAEQRALCVYTYASLTHDPAACELLMPSEHGWSCLGEVHQKIFGSSRTRVGELMPSNCG